MRWVEAVRWTGERAASDGSSRSGPGNVLTGLGKRIAPDVDCRIALQEPAQLDEVAGGAGGASCRSHEDDADVRLDGKTALGDRRLAGIGEAIARRLAARAPRWWRRRATRTSCAELPPGHRRAAACAGRSALDVADSRERSASASQTLPEAFAAIDILVNNAGITRDNLLAAHALEQWERCSAPTSPAPSPSPRRCCAA